MFNGPPVLSVAVPLLVIAEVETGLAVVQVRVPLTQLPTPTEIVQDEDAGNKVPDIALGAAVAKVVLAVYPVPVELVA